MKIIDLHGFRFREGLQLIISTLNECLIAQEIKIQIIHGYHTPTFKNYIQSAKFLRVMENEGFLLRKLPSNFNPGITIFILELNAKIGRETISNLKSPDELLNSNKKLCLEETKMLYSEKN